MIIAAVGLALGIGASLPLQSVARDTAEPVIVELALGRLTSRTVTSYRIGPTALLPLTPLFELAEIRVAASSPGHLEAIVEPSHAAIVVDVSNRRVEVAHRSIQAEPSEMVERDGEIYLSTRLLGQLLGVEWNVSWTDLAITALDPGGLPIAERISREWRRRSAQAAGDTPGTASPLGPGPRHRIDGLVLDYGVFTPTGQPLSAGAYSTALGLDLLGGSFTASLQSQTDAGRNGLRSDIAWSSVWRGQPWLTQLRVGDGISTGPRPRTVRGISFGNAPFLRPNEVGEVAFTGDLGPGWQVEAYRGGRLIGFDSVNALGKYSIDAPIAYGENPVELVAYGPFGEVRRMNRTYRVDANRLPVGRFEYGVAAGACRTDRCAATANVDLRYGLSTRWTLTAGVDQFWRDSSANLFHPYAGVFGTIGNSVGLETEIVANAILRGALRYEPSTDLILGVEATRFASGVANPILTPVGRTAQYTLTGLYRPIAARSTFYLDGSIDIAEAASGTIASGRLGGSFQLRELQLLPAVRWQRQSAGGFTTGLTTLELNSYLLPLPKLGAFFGQLTARSFLEVESTLRLSTINLFAGRNVNRDVRIETGGGWSRLQGAMFSINVAANLSSLRALGSLARSGGRTVASQYLQGSILYDREGGAVHLAAGPSLERAGITGRVFLDQNGNDRFDAGEELLPNVRVRVGMETRFSDARGEYRLWNVTPYEPAVIAIDSTTLASPLWVSSQGAVEVEPGPNRFRIVDIPIAPGGVIDGRVVRSDSTGVGGVTLILTELKTGRNRTIISFTDGTFYAMGIKPGEYRLSLDARTPVARSGLAADPVAFTMTAAADGVTVGDLVIRLR